MAGSTAGTFTRQRRDRPAAWFKLMAVGFAVAGVDKLFEVGGYRGLTRSFGWSRTQMQAAGAAEFVGAVLLVTPARRRLGGLVLLAGSCAVLAAELRSDREGLAVPRLALIGAALTALLP